MNDLKEKNRQKLYELQPHVHWSAARWHDECFDSGLEFIVTEVYRTQQRQNDLYAQGRWKPGRIVTWTLESWHTKRLACDIIVKKGTYREAALVAQKYGIRNPIPMDRGHFQFDKVGSRPFMLSKMARIRSLRRGIGRTVEPVRTLLQKQLERIRRRN